MKIELSASANRVIDLLEKSENFITMAQFRMYQKGCEELMDFGALSFSRKDGLDGYKLIPRNLPNKSDEGVEV